MIVKCEQCQTRFKIPDDKVTEKGVKVRCTKCQHTFRVKRDPPAEAAQAEDPFAKFGGAEGSPAGEETRPAVFALGVEASRLPELRVTTSGPPLLPLASTQTEVPRKIFEQPTAVRSVPPPPAGRRPLSDPPPLPFDFSAPPQAPLASPFDFTAPGRPPDPTPFDFAQPAPEEAALGFGQERATSPAAASPFDFASLGEPAAPPEKARTERVALPPAAVRMSARPAAAGTATQPAIAAPFDFGALPPAPAPAPPPMPRAAPSAPRNETPMFDFGALPELAQPPPPAPPPPAPSRPNPDTAQVSFSKPAGPPELPPDLNTFFESQEPAPAAPAAAASSALLPDVSDFFGESAGGPETGDGVLAERESRGNLFEMPTGVVAAPAPPAPAAPAASDNVAVGRIALRRVTADGVEVPRAGGVEVEETSSERRRRVLGVVANLVVGAVVIAVLVAIGAVALNDGRFDGGSLGKLRSQRQEHVAVDISNGLYETKTGRPIFYVRGSVENRGKAPGRMKVRAEILDKEQLVRAAEGFAGAAPSPEELSAVDGASGLEQLLARLSSTAKDVSPGARVPFVVAFYEYPPDLRGYQVKVTVDAAPSSRAER